MRSVFKKEHAFEQRKAEADQIREKYSDRIPVICEKADKTDIPTIDKKKYLVPSFVYVIRKRIKLVPEKAIFIFVGNILPATAAQMSDIYEKYKDDDGFLYVRYAARLTQLFWRKHIPHTNPAATRDARFVEVRSEQSPMHF